MNLIFDVFQLKTFKTVPLKFCRGFKDLSSTGEPKLIEFIPVIYIEFQASLGFPFFPAFYFSEKLINNNFRNNCCDSTSVFFTFYREAGKAWLQWVFINKVFVKETTGFHALRITCFAWWLDTDTKQLRMLLQLWIFVHFQWLYLCLKTLICIVLIQNIIEGTNRWLYWVVIFQIFASSAIKLIFIYESIQSCQTTCTSFKSHHLNMFNSEVVTRLWK